MCLSLVSEFCGEIKLNHVNISWSGVIIQLKQLRHRFGNSVSLGLPPFWSQKLSHISQFILSISRTRFRGTLKYRLPLVLMTIAYFQIVRVLWKSDTIPGHRESRNQTYICGCKWNSISCISYSSVEINSILVISDLRSGPSANSSTMGQLRARRKAAKMLVAVVIMFASCFFPVHVLNILR